MLKAIAHNYFKAENLEKVRPLVAELIAETHKEAGCIAYDLFEDIADPCHLTFVEEWESPEALQAHIASAHFQRLVPQLGELKAKEDYFVQMTPYSL